MHTPILSHYLIICMTLKSLRDSTSFLTEASEHFKNTIRRRYLSHREAVRCLSVRKLMCSVKYISLK